MYLLGALMVIFLLCTYFGTKERIHTPTSASGAKGVISDLRELVTNKPWWILLFTAFLYCTYNNIKQSMAAYFIGKYVPDADGNYLALYMACLLIVSVLASLLVSPLARRYGKKSTFIAAMLFSGVATISLYFVPSTNIQGVFAGGILSEAGAAMLSPLFFAMLGDAADLLPIQMRTPCGRSYLFGWHTVDEVWWWSRRFHYRNRIGSPWLRCQPSDFRFHYRYP
jgi:GPH family glycoside/pentoside/hexuronide:cation symporter